MSWEAAHRKALEDLQTLNPLVAANKGGALYEEGRFRLRLLNREFLISYPGGGVVEIGPEAAPSLTTQVLLLHYLIQASGAAIAGRWITYRELPGAYLFQAKFHNMAHRTLGRAFGQDAVGFRRAGLALGGMSLDRTGDAGFHLLALPRIPMAGILYLGEEDIPPSVNILFDASAPEYLSTDDLFVLGVQLSLALQKLKSG